MFKSSKESTSLGGVDGKNAQVSTLTQTHLLGVKVSVTTRS